MSDIRRPRISKEVYALLSLDNALFGANHAEVFEQSYEYAEIRRKKREDEAINKKFQTLTLIEANKLIEKGARG
jgi:hypothetical protein